MTAERFPTWMTKRHIKVEKVQQIKVLLKELKIKTLCEASKCPNIGECFSRPTMAFMILGDRCSRDCSFCAIEKGEPRDIDFDEPKKIAKAAKQLGLKHSIITSVCRDDLADGGAMHFAHALHELGKELSDTSIEVLIPDFNVNTKAIRTILKYNPLIFNHNIETVPRLYEKVRAKAHYEKSLGLLKSVKRIRPDIITKSGLMVGLGETEDEVFSVMKDLKHVKCDIITIGQYLQPTRYNIPVDDFITPETFIRYKEYGTDLGFLHVESAPFVRSTYNAELYITDGLKEKNSGKNRYGKISTYQEVTPLRI